MQSSLKKTIKEHYEKKQLSDDQLAGLLELQRVTKKRVKHLYAWGLVLVASVTIFLLYVWNYSPLSIQSKIVSEVAYNHNKHLDPEIRSESFRVIQNELPKLGFNLIDSEYFIVGWRLLGGRYCSIQGRMAAQLKIRKNDTDEIYTLYQVPFQEAWSKGTFSNAVTEVDGVVVKVWIEKGLLLALAGPF